MKKKVKNPKISIVMSVYNAQKDIAMAIDSILNQTFNDFEFIIINDASTDNSLKIINRYAVKDNRIILINNKKNIGQTISLNLGLRQAKGKYIARIDADDISMPERLQKEHEFLEKNTDIFLVGSWAININQMGKEVRKLTPECNGLKINAYLPKECCFYHSSIMFRNEKTNFYRDKFRYAQDYDLYLNLLTKGKKLINLPELLIKYRTNPSAISFSQKAKQTLFAEKAREFYQQRLNFGRDEYFIFNPNDILNIDVKNSNNNLIIRAEIESNFKLNNFKETKIFCKKYFENYGYFNKILIYYLSSFLGKNFVNFMRKILFY